MPANAELLEIALTIARRAADLARQRREEGVEVAASKSSLSDIVTRADREAEDLIRDAIAAARPDDGFYGEESGAVVNPAIGETFTGSAGGGAELNGRTLRVKQDTDLALALVGTGFGYDAERRVQQATIVADLIGRVRDIRRIGAASLDLCSVAAGRLDAYYERGLNPWDHAAGALIAREAGAQVGALAGARESADLLIAAEPALYAQLEPLLRPHFSTAG